jgi:hypothetical protein
MANSLALKQWFAILLLGHMTTAPWNMFINNQGFIEKRLNFVPVASIPEIKNENFKNSLQKQNSANQTRNNVQDILNSDLVDSSQNTLDATTRDDNNQIPALKEIKITLPEKIQKNRSIKQQKEQQHNQQTNIIFTKSETKQLQCISCSLQLENRIEQPKNKNGTFIESMNDDHFLATCLLVLDKNNDTSVLEDITNCDEGDNENCEWYNKIKSFNNNINDKNFLKIINNYKKCMKDSKSIYAKFWASNLSTVAMLISFCSTVLSTILIKIISEKFRIKGVWTIAFIIFLLCLIFAWTIYNPKLYFGLTLTLSTIIIFSSVLFQTTAFAFCSCMSYKFVVTLMEGQGLGAVWISSTKILCDYIQKILENKTGDKEFSSNVSVTIYWFLALLVVIITWILYDVVFVKIDEYKKMRSDTPESQQLKSDPYKNSDSYDNLPEKYSGENNIAFCPLINSIKYQALSIFINFFICLLLFPGVLSNVRPHDGILNVFGVRSIDWEFLNFALFFMFNIGDWIGKKAGNYAFIRSDQEILLLLISCIRFLFYPLILFGLNTTGTREGILSNKYSLIIANLIFATTSGYMGCLPMRFAPECVERKFKNKHTEAEIKDAKGRASTIMLIFIIGGLLCGSLCSFFPVYSINKEVDNQLNDRFMKFVLKDSIFDDFITRIQT